MKKFSLAILCFVALTSKAQHYTAKSLVDTLCSPNFFGRGYVQNGALKTAHFLASTFENIGLLPGLTNSYTHTFTFSVNTFPNSTVLTVNKRKLVLGEDYIPSPSSGSTKGTFETQILVFDENEKTEILLRKIKQLNPKKITLVKKSKSTSPKAYASFVSEIENTPLNLNSLIEQEKLTGSFANSSNTSAVVLVKEGLIEEGNKIELRLENKLLQNHSEKNVVAKIPGQSSDSCYVLTGHYDHLGGWGNTVYVPGANDNASGISFLVQAAQNLVNKTLPYDIYFIAFGAEEVGLIGSKAFVDEHLNDIPPIKSLLNFDLMGTGSEGICVVNATVFPKEFNQLKREIELVNPEISIQKRGKAANSDHYWFSEKGIPAFFIYTKGGSPAYHHINDVPSNLTYDLFPSLLTIVEHFISQP